jgi:hypothetical protein
MMCAKRRRIGSCRRCHGGQWERDGVSRFGVNSSTIHIWVGDPKQRSVLNDAAYSWLILRAVVGRLMPNSPSPGISCTVAARSQGASASTWRQDRLNRPVPFKVDRLAPMEQVTRTISCYVVNRSDQCRGGLRLVRTVNWARESDRPVGCESGTLTKARPPYDDAPPGQSGQGVPVASPPEATRHRQPPS